MSSIEILTWWEQSRFLGTTLTGWAFAIATTLAVYLACTIGLRLAVAHLGRLSINTETRLDDLVVEVLRGTKHWLVMAFALLVGVGMLEPPARWGARADQLWFVAAALQFALWVNRAIGLGLRYYVERHASSGMTHVGASATLMSWALRTLLWTILLLATLSNMGVNITAFVASLGVGGVAVALAVQNILGDLFASLSIAVDKPFEVGDFITVGEIAGSVENVGLKTTRIRSIGGEQIIISNTELLKQTVRNYKRLQERRIVFTFGVTYETRAEQAEMIPGMVRKIIEAHPKARFNRAQFKGFGDSSLDFEVVYIVLDADYQIYMDVQQTINLELMRELASIGVEFAFPTRTIHLVSRRSESAPDQASPTPAVAHRRPDSPRSVDRQAHAAR